ncbi:SulP family inorganic anion transporter [Streptomyces sp. NPDC059255]|uniref:SulP family inorganic anion transporter n=1 Tax=Streptomyces sp. NPDC059255 TaxID=3346793 RepID=UPI0036ACC0A8
MPGRRGERRPVPRHTCDGSGTRKGLRSRLPGVALLTGYRRSWLTGDVLAGVTVAAYLVPQVMAYASVAGVPPVTGLWAALPALVLYALLGTSRLLSVGPESTTALMTAAVVGPLAAGDPGRYGAVAATLAVTLALLCLAAWAARLGFIADLLSRPVLVGYLAGIALLMTVDQLPKLTGVPTTGSDFFPQLLSFLRDLSGAEAATVAFSTALLAFLFVAPHRWPAVPRPLLAVVLGTGVVALFGWEDRGIAVVGTVPSGLPHPALPDLSELPRLLVPALGVLLVGYSDVILTGRAFAERDERERLDPNQELLSLGAVNLGASLFHGFPVSSSASRTALAASTGARTQAYSLVACAAVLGVLLFLGSVLGRIPVPVLGALVVYAAVRLIDLAGFRRLAAFRRREFLLATGCLLGVLALGILYGVLVAVGLSVAELLSRVARPHDAVEGLVPGVAGMHDVDDYPKARTIPGLLIYRYDSPLFFANAENFKRRALATLDKQTGPVLWFVLNTEANVEVDITALDSVEELRREVTERGIVFAMARVKQDLRDQLDVYGLSESVGRELIFPTLPTAVAAYRKWRGRPDGEASG